MAQTSTIRVKNRAQVTRAVEGLARACAGNTPAARDMRRAMGQALLERIADNYRRRARGGTDQNGLKWAPLKKSTIKRKAKWADRAFKQGKAVVGGIEVMRETDALLDSLTFHGVSPYQIFRILPGAVEVGSKVRYALDHHRGVPPNLPARPLWADPALWRPSWWRPIPKAAGQGAARVLQEMLRASP
jgi:hypothetical protein